MHHILKREGYKSIFTKKAFSLQFQETILRKGTCKYTIFSIAVNKWGGSKEKP